MAETVFAEWIESALDEDELQEAGWLARAVEYVRDDGLFKCEATADGGYVVSRSGDSNTLFLTDDEDRLAMLEHLRTEYMEEMDSESYLGLAYAEEKDRAKYGE